MDKRAAAPNAANKLLKTFSHLFKWATEAGHIEVNPVIGVSKVSVKSDGFHTWTVEQVEQYRKHHKLGTRPRLAIDILLFLGLRGLYQRKTAEALILNGCHAILRA